MTLDLGNLGTIETVVSVLHVALADTMDPLYIHMRF